MIRPLLCGLSLMSLCVVPSLALAQTGDAKEEMKKLQGRWKIVELVDDGRVVAPDQIQEGLPSGGRFEIVDNAMLFTSPLDGQKSAKTFSIDPTVYPAQMALLNGNTIEAIGIYQFSNSDRLVVCMTRALGATKPDDFSARAGSKRLLMVVERDSAIAGDTQFTSTSSGPREIPAAIPNPPPSNNPPAAAAAARVLSDADVTSMLIGAWRLNDSAGVLDVKLSPDRTFRSFRQVEQMSTFHNVFSPSPVGSGTWDVKNGQLSMRVTASVRPERVNQILQFAVRSISTKDMIFLDSLGRVGRAEKLP